MIFVGANMINLYFLCSNIEKKMFLYSKLLSLMIENVAKVVYFQYVKINPIKYRNIKKVPRITSDIFVLWVIDLQKDLRKDRQKISLSLDNGIAHKIRDLHLLIFPENMALHVHPIDMDIIKDLTDFFDEKVLAYLLETQRERQKMKMYVFKLGWTFESARDEVTPKTIKNCFVKTDFFLFWGTRYRDHWASRRMGTDLKRNQS